MPPTDRPQWDGASLPNGRLLLIADQGYGDVIQFARYIPWAAAPLSRYRGRVQHRTAPGRRATGRRRHRVFDHWERRPEFAALLRAVGAAASGRHRARDNPRRDAVSASRPSAPARGLGGAAGDAGAARHAPHRHRVGRPSDPPQRPQPLGLAGGFAPLGDLPDVALFSLQKGPGQAQIGAYWGRAPLFNLGPEIRDFGDTMAIIDGARSGRDGRYLGRRMSPARWASRSGSCCPYAPDWRWLLGPRRQPLVSERPPVPPRPRSKLGAGDPAHRSGNRGRTPAMTSTGDRRARPQMRRS